MSWKSTERLIATFVFLWAFLLYLSTVSPTASFWDSGEFIAIANQLQVSHPPGAPFYMLIGRLFSMFSSPEYVALSVNLVSVLASALTVLLTFLIIVRVAREWHPADRMETTQDRIAVWAGGVIGALAYAGTDSFWFNAVEAEVYALSMFFTAVVVWLIMKWSELARQEEAELAGKNQHPFGLSANRYLILIAYMFGLAIGVHLLNLLAIFFIALIFFFREIDRSNWSTGQRWTGLIATGVVSVLIFLVIYPGMIQWLPGVIGESGAPIFWTLALVLLVVAGLYVSHTRQMPATNLAFLYVAVVLIGYTTYALIFIRSAANPPIDENDPETVEAIVSYLKREQYGDTPLFKGSTYDNATNKIDYDHEKLFPRRHSPAPPHLAFYAQYDSDWDFFWEYQVRDMYFRYFLWNFSGKGSDEQDAPAITGFSFIDHPDYGPERFVQTPSERESRNVYFALPLLLGLFGAIYHFMRDWRRAFSIFVLFFVTGIGIILYLNQTPMQPRERDYSYVASFFAFSLWIGIGATGILQLVQESLSKKMASQGGNGILIGTGVVLFAAVPLWMTIENYHDHSRAGNYVAPEYAYNMLMSVADDAILVTNGDNDTFPLWYLQEVEEVRRDVRVVNVSLLNTPWYIKQLKNQASRDSEPLPFSMTDEQVDELNIRPWQPRDVSLPVNLDAMMRSSEVPIAMDDTSQIESPMTWTLRGRPYDERINLLYVSDLALYDILLSNAQNDWKRPFYFAVTVSSDGLMDLDNYFQLEGQAFRVVPIKHDEQLGRVVPGITPERLKKFKFTNLNNPDVYYDENIRRMVDNYRNIFSTTAQQLGEAGDRTEAIALMDRLMDEIPFTTIPGTPQSYLVVARAFQLLGVSDRAVEVWRSAEPVVLDQLQRARTRRQVDTLIRYIQMIQLGYIELSDFDAAAAFSNRIADALNDDVYRQTPEQLRAERDRLFSPEDSVDGN
ncbi:MAG: DUF2723 domain-containing protein [Rhodothermales bacterium]